MPAIPTSALPDIIFMLLFFFMVTTKMRETEVMVEQQLPQATQLQKLEKRALVAYIYIGKPRNTEQYGDEPRIQVNDVFVSPDEIPNFIQQQRSLLSEAERDEFVVAIKGDQDATRGVIIDVEEKLREAKAFKLRYPAKWRVEE